MLQQVQQTGPLGNSLQLQSLISLIMFTILVFFARVLRCASMSFQPLLQYRAHHIAAGWQGGAVLSPHSSGVVKTT